MSTSGSTSTITKAPVVDIRPYQAIPFDTFCYSRLYDKWSGGLASPAVSLLHYLLYAFDRGGWDEPQWVVFEDSEDMFNCTPDELVACALAFEERNFLSFRVEDTALVCSLTDAAKKLLTTYKKEYDALKSSKALKQKHFPQPPVPAIEQKEN